LGQSLCDSLEQCPSAVPPAVLGFTFTLADPDPVIIPSAHRHPSPRPTSYGLKLLSSPLEENSRDDTKAPLGYKSVSEKNKVKKQYIHIHREIRRPSAAFLSRRHGATVLGHVVALLARHVDMLCLEPRVAIARPTRISHSPHLILGQSNLSEAEKA